MPGFWIYDASVPCVCVYFGSFWVSLRGFIPQQKFCSIIIERRWRSVFRSCIRLARGGDLTAGFDAEFVATPLLAQRSLSVVPAARCAPVRAIGFYKDAAGWTEEKLGARAKMRA